MSFWDEKYVLKLKKVYFAIWQYKNLKPTTTIVKTYLVQTASLYRKKPFRFYAYDGKT